MQVRIGVRGECRGWIRWMQKQTIRKEKHGNWGGNKERSVSKALKGNANCGGGNGGPYS